MDQNSRSRFQSAENILNRSKSLYDGTRYTMHLSSIKSKLQTVSSSIASSSPFSSVPRDKSSSSLTGSKSGCSERDEAEKRLRERSQHGTQINPDKQHRDKSEQKPSRSRKRCRGKQDRSKAIDSFKVETPQARGLSQYPTVEYQVKSGDTLTSVAARFDITPSELCRVNRLFCRSLFPGQQIKVPSLDKETDQMPSSSLDEGQTTEDSNQFAKNEAHAVTRNKTHTESSRADSIIGSVSVETDVSIPSECSTANRRFIKRAEHEEENSLGVEYEEESSGRSSDGSSAMGVSCSEPFDNLLEENDPLAAKYLKLDATCIVNLHSAIPGLLLITTDSLMFTPNDRLRDEVDQMHLLLPFSQLRSIAAYADHSVMYFTRRDMQSKFKIRQHQPNPTHGGAVLTALKTENSEPNFLTRGDNISLSGVMNVSVSSEKESPRVAITEADAPPSRSNDNLRDSVLSVTSADHLAPSTRLTQKSKSAEFSLSNHCLISDSKPTCSLNDLDHPSSVVYLCILAYPTGCVRKRHPHWFTLQSLEYWFRIPEEKSELLFDFLLVCDFQEEISTDPSDQIPLPKDDCVGVETVTTSPSAMETIATIMHIKGHKSSPDNLFLSSPTMGGDNKPTGFVVVPNTFDWVLPRIGSIDECSKLMLQHSQQRKRRRHSSREPEKLRGESVIIKTETQPVSCSFHDSGHLDHTEAERIQKTFRGPSLEEEKTALQLLKRESVRWEWIRAPLRALWHHIEHWLVNAAELEEEQRNMKRREYILNCLKMVTPETLPLPLSTEHSAILDAHRVRDLMQNLPPEAEGLDWQMTYSTALHGFSLRTFYYRCAMRHEDEESNCNTLMSTGSVISATAASSFSSQEPCLIVIRTVKDEIFGAMLNMHPYPSSGRFYGNGSCYVFRWVPDVRRPVKQTKRRQSSCPLPSTTAIASELEESSDEKLTESRSKQDMTTVAQTVQTRSPPRLPEPCGSPHSASSLSDFDPSALIEQGEELTEEFARMLYLDNVEPSETTNEVGEQRKMKFQKYPWTGKNAFFISGETDSISIGCSQGHSALHLDDVLLHGRTDSCDTFDNEPLSESRDFVVSDLEIWSFR
ncbi:hypothetical protein D915_004594 [Fasciola hepatica]|uniref:Oxidation resistance protein 1 n=1 Tax=Fasciola hepatica TaxID=6192 RepID=A0A4E0RUL0_FASHE|nr:hypothetical protein D915_004594 [Fasciola hepatica]